MPYGTHRLVSVIALGNSEPPRGPVLLGASQISDYLFPFPGASCLPGLSQQYSFDECTNSYVCRISPNLSFTNIEKKADFPHKLIMPWSQPN